MMKYIFPEGAEPNQSRLVSLVVTLVVGIILGFIVATLMGVYHNPVATDFAVEGETTTRADTASQATSVVAEVTERASGETVPAFISAGRDSLITGEVVEVSSTTIIVKNETDQALETVKLVEATLVIEQDDTCNPSVPVLCETMQVTLERLTAGAHVRITLQQLTDDAMKIASLIEVSK